MASLVSPMTTEKVYTMGSAFGVGVLNGWIGKSNPAAALLTTVVSAAGGLIGSLMTTGRTADIMEGLASGSLGSLGYSIPSWLSSSTTETTSRNLGASRIRSIKMLPSPIAKGKKISEISPRGRVTGEFLMPKEFENVELYP